MTERDRINVKEQSATIQRLVRQLESITLCAESALECLPHGSDRYDLAVAVDQSRELFKEMFLAGRAAGAGGVVENATPKDATENEKLCDVPGAARTQGEKGNESR